MYIIVQKQTAFRFSDAQKIGTKFKFPSEKIIKTILPKEMLRLPAFGRNCDSVCI